MAHQYFWLLCLWCLHIRRLQFRPAGASTILFLPVNKLTILLVLSIRCFYEFTPTVLTLHHCFITVMWISSVIKAIDLFKSPISFVVDHLKLHLWELRRNFSFRFRLFCFIDCKFFKALRVVYFKTSKTEITSANTA